MGQTLLSEKLKKAGFDTNATLLRAMAVAELQKTSIMIAGKPSLITSETVARALGPFTAEVRDAGGVLASLVPYSTTRDLAWGYLKIVARDMRGSEKTGSGGAQGCDDGQLLASAPLPVANSEGEGAQRRGESQMGPRPSPSETQAGGGAARRLNSLSSVPRPPAPPARPRPSGVMAERAALRSIGSNTLFESTLFRGEPIGKIRWDRFVRLGSESARETALAKLIRDHIDARCVPRPEQNIEDLIGADDLARLKQKAAEMTDD